MRNAAGSSSSVINAMYEQRTNVKSIDLYGVMIDKSFLTALMEPFCGTLYCPNLTAITTAGIPGDEIVRSSAGDCWYPDQIKRVVMRQGDTLNEDDERSLRENVQSFERWWFDLDGIDGL
jgi:hypothetical protein